MEIGSLIRQKPTSDQDLASDASAAPCSVEALEAILAKMKQSLAKKRCRSGLPPDAKGFFQDRVLRDCNKKNIFVAEVFRGLLFNQCFCGD